MALFAVAVPITPGKEDEWRRFADELAGARRREFTESRRLLGVRERTFVQQTPHGSTVIVTLEGDDPAAAFAAFGRGSDPFTQWFKRNVKEVHGFDLDAPPPGPLPELVVDSSDEQRD